MKRNGRESPPQTVRILLVDDDPESLIALEAILESLGQELIKANSGVEALRHVLKDDFAVILLDVRMPDLDGFETARMIRERVRSRHTPLLFLTGYRDDELRFRGYDLGAVDYLTKPVVPEILRSKVSVFVELHKKNAFLRQYAEALEGKKTELERAIATRTRAEEEVRTLNTRLAERLAELRVANQRLETLYEKDKEIDKLKTQFFTNISHELRTPLALVLGSVERLLRSESFTPEQRHHVETIERHSTILLKQVNDLLDISKLDAAKMGLNYADVDMAQLVSFTTGCFEDLARERRISFTMAAPSSLPVQVDAEKAQRVLLNLFSNAFKHTPDGGKVHCHLSADQERLFISIQDSGVGVPPELRDVIFERFWQGDPSPGGRFGGTGLGLSIAQEFAQLHGGHITVHDAPGGGACFTVELPLTAPAGTEIRGRSPEPTEIAAVARLTLAQLAWPQQEDRDSEQQSEGVTIAPDESKPLLLVVEDNQAMNRFLRETLAAEFRVEVAFDGEQGLQKAVALSPDLILTDVMMPGTSGERMIRQIRTMPELNAVPIVVLTAKADQELRTNLLEQGVQDYLTKPFSVAEMLARLRNLVTMKRTRDVLQAEIESRSENLETMAQTLAQRKREAQLALAVAEESNRARDQFLATISHEMRTPLTAIIGWARLLRTGNLDKESFSRALETIERNARAQAKLIEDLLDTSRIITGKMRLDVRTMELPPVIQAAIDAVRPAVEANAIQLYTVLDPDAGPVLGDPDRLQQVVWNLLSNAVKFTPREGRVQVRLERVNAEAHLTVIDSGKGIKPEFLPYVFDRFRQGDSSTTRTHSGLGLGLAIVRHLVELHGGTVQADSPGEGGGASFQVRLPLVIAAVESHVPLATVDRESTVDLRGLRVLVVEDEADTREMICLTLRRYGAKVTPASSAAEALKALRRIRPDLLLADIEMADEDGYTLLRKVKALESARREPIPAFALTAHTRPEDRRRAFAEGFQLHIPKPIEPAALASIVAEWWAGKPRDPDRPETVGSGSER